MSRPRRRAGGERGSRARAADRRGHSRPGCRRMVDRLSEYLDGELSAGLRRLVEAHGGECPPCRSFVRTLEATVRAVRSLPRDPLPPAARHALAEALRKAGAR